MAHKNKLPRVNAAGAVVYDYDPCLHPSLRTVKILLVKSWKSKTWGIPKGHVEKDETLHQTALREVKEETGVRVVLHTDQKLPVVTTYNRKEIKDVHAWFATKCDDVEISTSNDPDNEVEQVKWFNIDNLPMIHKYQRPLIESAVSNLRDTILKEDDDE